MQPKQSNAFSRARSIVKNLLPLLAFAIAHLSVITTVLATQDATAIASGTTDLTAEFLSWKASAAGQQAYVYGFVPASSTQSASTMSEGPTAEELRRFQAAKERIALIQKEQPLAVFSVETPFTLLTPEEFTAYVNKGGVKEFRRLMEDRILAQGNVTTEYHRQTPVSDSIANTADIPAVRNLESEAQQGWVVDTDWQTKGCVTRIKHQGKCGSCSMFATIGALESGYCVKSGGTLYELSEQDVISCATGSGEGRCGGAWNPDNLRWISQFNGGSVCTEKSYPYLSASGVAPACGRYIDQMFVCETPNLGAKLYGGGVFTDHTELEKVVRRQPVAADLFMSDKLFQYYKGGVLRGNQETCPAGAENHAVVIVGFGLLDGVPYWKCKNQWGEDWGDHGWFYLERGFQGHPSGACGIESYAHYPIFVDEGDSAENKRCSGARYGVELVGKTRRTLTLYRPEYCCDECRADSGCEGYNYYTNANKCVLLDGVTGEKLKVENVYAGTSTTKLEQLKKMTILRGYDYPGNDLIQAKARTPEDCGDLCNQYPTCHAFAWSKLVAGMCFLKSTAPTAVSAETGGDGKPFTFAGTVYKCQSYQLNVDFAGGDIKSVQGRVEDCCGHCRNTQRCAAFTWTGYNGGTCWLKGVSYTAAAATDASTISATV